MANDTIVDYAEGVVQSANERGFKLDTTGDEWVNISRYAKPQPIVPVRGSRVRVGFDKSGFARTVEPAGDSAPTGSHAAATSSPGVSAKDGTVGYGHPREASRGEPYAVGADSAEREARITRLAVLNTATAILSSGSRAADPREVLVLAAVLERWATRSAGDEQDYQRFLAKLQPPAAGQDPATVLGTSEPGEPTQTDFFALAGTLRFAGQAEICQALGLDPDAGGKPNPFAARDWVHAGHSWQEAMGRLRAWRQTHAQEAASGPV